MALHGARRDHGAATYHGVDFCFSGLLNRPDELRINYIFTGSIFHRTSGYVAVQVARGYRQPGPGGNLIYRVEAYPPPHLPVDSRRGLFPGLFECEREVFPILLGVEEALGHQEDKNLILVFPGHTPPL